MKHTLLIITALMLMLGCSGDTIKLESNNLIDRAGLMYAPNDDEPFTGGVFDFYENGEKELDGNYRKGLMNGEWTYYHENGQIHAQGRFIDGDGSNPSELTGIPFNGRSGRWKFWYENGQKSTEGTYRNGNLIGKYEKWFKNGTEKWEEYNNDDGTRDSTKLTILWYENGQKQFEGYWKNTDDTTSVWDGKYTEWYENGQKGLEVTFKDGELIESTHWDEDGNKQEQTYIEEERKEKLLGEALIEDLEQSLMAPCCWSGTVAAHGNSEMESSIREMVSQGLTRQQVLDKFVAIYGEKILAKPKG